MQYTIVDPQTAKTVMDGTDPQWKKELLAGRMLLTDGPAPQWSVSDRTSTGKRLRSRRSEHEGKRYVWLEDIPAATTDGVEVDPLSLVG